MILADAVAVMIAIAIVLALPCRKMLELGTRTDCEQLKRPQQQECGVCGDSQSFLTRRLGSC